MKSRTEILQKKSMINFPFSFVNRNIKSPTEAKSRLKYRLCFCVINFTWFHPDSMQHSSQKLKTRDSWRWIIDCKQNFCGHFCCPRQKKIVKKLENKTEHAVQPQRRQWGWNNLHEFIKTDRLTDGLTDWQTDVNTMDKQIDRQTHRQDRKNV